MKASVAGLTKCLLFQTLLAAGGFLTHARANYAFTNLNDPSGTFGSWATGISGSDVVGYYNDKDDNWHGFLLTGSSSYFTLDDPDAVQDSSGLTNTYPAGIDGGNIVGTYYGEDGTHGFLYNESTYTTLDDPSAAAVTYAEGISGSNVTGWYQDSSGNFHGFFYNGATYTTLDDPSGTGGTYAQGVSGSNVTGYYYDVSGDAHGFLYSGTTYTTLNVPSAAPGSSPLGGTYAIGISGSNIVGYYFDAQGGHGFLYNGTSYLTLNRPAALFTYACGISGSTITGYYMDSEYITHGFRATPTNAGQYTLLLTGTGAPLPPGTGYATMTVGTTGGAVGGGKLPDGEAFSISGTLSGSTPGAELVLDKSLVYPSPTVPGAKGLLSGTLSFVSVAGTGDLSGTLEWVKPQQKKGMYPTAINTPLSVIGSLYAPPVNAQSVLPGFSSGVLVLSDTGTLSVSGSGSLVKDVTLVSPSKFEVTNPGADKLTITVTASTGSFKGTFHYPGKKNTVTDFSGVLFQDQTLGGGLFLGPDGSGAVLLLPGGIP